MTKCVLSAVHSPPPHMAHHQGQRQRISSAGTSRDIVPSCGSRTFLFHLGSSGNDGARHPSTHMNRQRPTKEKAFQGFSIGNSDCGRTPAGHPDLRETAPLFFLVKPPANLCRVFTFGSTPHGSSRTTRRLDKGFSRRFLAAPRARTSRLMLHPALPPPSPGPALHIQFCPRMRPM